MPPRALAFNSSWELLADTLQEDHKGFIARMSRIPEELVCCGRSHALSAATILQYASTRETTRPEDRAYSLMGLLGIRMSPDYGEGEISALTRLLETVVNVTGDISVFGWSGIYSGSERPGRSMFPNSFEAYKNAPHGPPVYAPDVVTVSHSGVKSVFESFGVEIRIEDSNTQMLQILLENSQYQGVSASNLCKITAKGYYPPLFEHYAPEIRKRAAARGAICSMEVLTTLGDVRDYIGSLPVSDGWVSSLPALRYSWSLMRFAWADAPWFLCKVQHRGSRHPSKMPKIRRLPAEIAMLMSNEEIIKGFQLVDELEMEDTMDLGKYLIE